MNFLKQFLSSILLISFALPRLLIGMALFLIPNIITTYFIGLLLSGGNLAELSQPNNIVTIVSGLLGLLGSIYLLEETRYGEIIKTIWPF